MNVIYLIYIAICTIMAHLFRFYLLKNKETVNILKTGSGIEVGRKAFPKDKYYLAVVFISGLLDVLAFCMFYIPTGLFFIAPFFYVQTYSDIQNKMVYVFINRLFLVFSLTLFILSEQYRWLLDIPTLIFTIFVIVFFFILTKCKRLGMGDYVTIVGFLFLYYTLAGTYNYCYFGILCFLDFILLSNIPLNVYGMIRYRCFNKAKKVQKQKISVAFYPFMLIGSIGTMLIILLKIGMV